MKAFLLYFLVLLMVGSEMKLAGTQLPNVAHSLGGPIAQRRIQVVQPNLNLP